MRLLKTILAITLVLVFGVTILFGWLVLSVDPNDYKPELKKLAAENSIELNIEGAISWSLFPTLAIDVGATELSSIRHSIPATTFKRASLSLNWSALLQRKIRFQAINIENADLLINSQQQAINVAALPAATAIASTQTQGATNVSMANEALDLPFQLDINSFQLTDGRITVVDPQGEKRLLENVQFSSSDLNFDNKPFPISLSLETPLLESKPALSSFSANLMLSLAPLEIRAQQATLTVTEPSIAIQFAAIYENTTDTLAISAIEGTLQSAVLNGALTVKNLQSQNASLEGTLGLQKIRPQEWLEEPPEGISQINFSTTLAASEQQITLNPFTLEIDGFSGAGSASYSPTKPRQLALSFSGNTLDLTSTTNTKETASQNGAPSSASTALLTPILAPLALLEGGKGHIEVDLKALKSNETTITRPHLNLFSNGNVIHVTDLSGGVFDGQFQLESKINFTTPTPTLTVKTRLEKIDIKQALPDTQDISGLLSMNFNGKSQGDATEQLLNSLAGTGDFSVADPVIENLNIERSYCELAALIERVDNNRDWPAYTRLSPLTGNFQWRNQSVELSNVSTGLGNMAIKGKGKIKLEPETFNMLITTNLQGDRTSETGCQIKSKRIRNRDIPLRCKGSFGENSESQCLPDENFIKQVLQEKLMEKLFGSDAKESNTTDTPNTKDSTTDNQEPSSEESSQPLDKDELKKRAIEELLRGIFKP